VPEQALAMLDRAQICLRVGISAGLSAWALEARGIAEEFIYGPSVVEPEKPVEEPDRPGEEATPWLFGYVVVFDHEPTPDEWADLKEMFNATVISEASVYVDEKYSYWVRVSGFSPDDLEEAEGVKDVLAFRGDVIGPAESDTQQVPELLLWCSVMAGGLLTVRRTRRS